MTFFARSVKSIWKDKISTDLKETKRKNRKKSETKKNGRERGRDRGREERKDINSQQMKFMD